MENPVDEEAQEPNSGRVRQALAIAKGELDPSTYAMHVPDEIDVKTLRRRLKLSQTAFAKRYGFNPARIRDWDRSRANKVAEPVDQ